MPAPSPNATGNDRSASSRPEFMGRVEMRPALLNIADACLYLGKIGRAKFYADYLPRLDVVKFGTRTAVTLDSLDRLIDSHRRQAAA